MDFSYMKEKNWISQKKKKRKFEYQKKDSQEKYGLKA